MKERGISFRRGVGGLIVPEPPEGFTLGARDRDRSREEAFTCFGCGEEQRMVLVGLRPFTTYRWHGHQVCTLKCLCSVVSASWQVIKAWEKDRRLASATPLVMRVATALVNEGRI